MTNQTAQVLAFPSQMCDLETGAASMSDEVLMHQIRLRAASLMNQVATGQREALPDEARQAITELNEIYGRYGFPLLSFDF